MTYVIVRIVDDTPTAYGPYKTIHEARVAAANLSDAYIKKHRLPRTWLDATPDGREILIQPPEDVVDYKSSDCAVFTILQLKKGV